VTNREPSTKPQRTARAGNREYAVAMEGRPISTLRTR
jgi:hypothetical protein